MKLPLYREGVVNPEELSLAMNWELRERKSSRRLVRELLNAMALLVKSNQSSESSSAHAVGWFERGPAGMKDEEKQERWGGEESFYECQK